MRQWLPKEPRGRSHSGKGDVSAAPAPASTSAGSGPGQAPSAAVTTDSAPVGSPASGPSPAQWPGQSKKRPVIGLGRQFKVVLNGAGMAVSAESSSGPGDRRRGDQGGKSRAGPGAGKGRGSTESSGTGKVGKQKRREGRSHLPEVVLGILQRPAETASPDVVIMQRPQSPRRTEGLAVHGEGGPGGPSGPNDTGGAGPGGAGGSRRGNTRSGRGRGRGGHHGGYILVLSPSWLEV